MPTTEPEAAPEGFLTVNEFESQFVDIYDTEQDGRDALREGRQWVADAFYGEDGDTIRTLRLRKGLSQFELAELISSKQPYVSRIECGTVDLTMSTCRKLSDALEIDMNTLDAALREQEERSQLS